ncbi:hypothetical protein VEE57_44830 (plasmid) [Escherichia coli]|nr:hypothetical protein VEE57_44830 [Escherichia coli]
MKLNAEYEREKKRKLEVDLEVRRVREIEKLVAEIEENGESHRNLRGWSEQRQLCTLQATNEIKHRSD